MNNLRSSPEQLGVNGYDDYGDSALRTTNKRRRIAIACSACRTRKSRVRERPRSLCGDYLLTLGVSVRRYTPKVQLVCGVRIRLCLRAIILIKQRDSWQGVSLLTCVSL